ncbi:MAG: GNAT family N-acetyltransferase [Tunicatimonas sp.]|uniref:GNAT family N-acetyltransferase n=1 Tax=Tunicatimonas sp. TaxID=1940096 RepID=UPI003C79626A
MKSLVIQNIATDQIPLDLLLLADPSEKQINTYLSQAKGYAAREGGRIVGACVVKVSGTSTVEIMNIAVYSDCQDRGIGTKLLRYAIDRASLDGTRKILVKTGTFGYQLTFYQRLGFRVVSVERDYFLNTYNEPLFESGIQHQDQLVLELRL